MQNKFPLTGIELPSNEVINELFVRVDRKWLLRGHLIAVKNEDLPPLDATQRLLMETLSAFMSPMLTNTPGEFYSPMAIWEGGRRTVIPSDFSDEDIDTILNLASVIGEDGLIGRANDFAWMRRMNKPHYGILAALSYLNTAEELIANQEEFHARPYVQRAIYIARRIRNQEIQDRVTDILRRRVSISTEIERANALSSWTALLLKNGMQELFPEAYDAVSRLASVEGIELHGKEALLAHKYALANKLKLDTSLIRGIQLEQGECQIELGIQRGTGDNCSALAASYFFQSALKFYQSGGATSDIIDRTKARVKESQTDGLREMTPVESVIDVSELHELVDEHMRFQSLEEALIRLSTIDRLQNLSIAKEQLARTGSTFMDMIPSSIIDMEGRTITRDGIGTDKDDETKCFQSSANHWQLRANGLIAPAIHKINNALSVRDEDLFNVISRSFLVPDEYATQIARGLNCGLHGELMISTALLAPTFEPLLRHYYRVNGIVTDVFSSDLTQEAGMLSRLLDIGIETQTLPEAWKYEIEGHLIRKEAFNIRNKVAHGLMTDDNYYEVGNLSFWWLILKWIMHPLAKNYY